MWLSLVEHSVRDAGVGGSNPLIPTSFQMAFLKELGIDNAEEVLGLRLGETLHCVHAFEKPNGCGTTESCLSRGAAIAEDKTQKQVCALLNDKTGTVTNTCLLIKAQPIRLEDNRWILIYAQDITRQQFWINLERIFFHDSNNVLTYFIQTISSSPGFWGIWSSMPLSPLTGMRPSI